MLEALMDSGGKVPQTEAGATILETACTKAMFGVAWDLVKQPRISWEHGPDDIQQMVVYGSKAILDQILDPANYEKLPPLDINVRVIFEEKTTRE
jgi:hypothetical protein